MPDRTLLASLQAQKQIFAKSFSPFTGADMHVVFNNREIGMVNALTVTITRDVAARYTAGSADPRGFAKGRRGIAGSMNFSMYDRDPLLRDVFQSEYQQKLADIWFKSQGLYNSANYSFTDANGQSLSSMPSAFANVPGAAGISPDALQAALAAYQAQGTTNLQYLDQLPPIDVTVTFANEAGQVSVASLRGVVFLSEGMGWSMADIETEVSTTYLARSFDPLSAVVQPTNAFNYYSGQAV